MGKVIEENGVLWYEEREFISGVWHTGRTYIGLADKPNEDKPKKAKKGEEN